jgi:hypothetical protein
MSGGVVTDAKDSFDQSGKPASCKWMVKEQKLGKN